MVIFSIYIKNKTNRSNDATKNLLISAINTMGLKSVSDLRVFLFGVSEKFQGSHRTFKGFKGVPEGFLGESDGFQGVSGGPQGVISRGFPRNHKNY